MASDWEAMLDETLGEQGNAGHRDKPTLPQSTMEHQKGLRTYVYFSGPMCPVYTCIRIRMHICKYMLVYSQTYIYMYIHIICRTYI